MPIKQYQNADKKIAPTIPPARKQGSTLQKIDSTQALNFCLITYPSFLDGQCSPAFQDKFDQPEMNCQSKFASQSK
jgi:hypothetical protein